MSGIFCGDILKQNPDMHPIFTAYSQVAGGLRRAGYSGASASG